MVAWDSTYMPDLTGRIAVVTGANTGIGLRTAKALANKHAHVVLACRNQERGLQAQQEVREETGNADVAFMQVDMGSVESIRAFSEALHQRFDHIDLLINNAGVMGAKFKTTTDGFEAHFGTNYLGPFLMTSLLFDQLKASQAARVVSLSSVAHRQGKADFSTVGYPADHWQHWMRPYGTSKLAINLFTFELDRRLRAAGLDNVKAVIVHPGVAVTNLMQWSPGFTKFAATMSSCFTNTPEMAALPTLYAATEESVQGGEYYGPGGFAEWSGPPKRVEATNGSHSLEDAAKLWKRSEELLHSRFDVQ